MISLGVDASGPALATASETTALFTVVAVTMAGGLDGGFTNWWIGLGVSFIWHGFFSGIRGILGGPTS